MEIVPKLAEMAAEIEFDEHTPTLAEAFSELQGLDIELEIPQRIDRGNAFVESRSLRA